MNLAYPWEGPRTYIRLRVTRGSAAGSSLAGVTAHILAGLDHRGRDRALCGALFESGTTRTAKPDVSRVCGPCKEAAARE
jgi:hypothetical protein